MPAAYGDFRNASEKLYFAMFKKHPSLSFRLMSRADQNQNKPVMPETHLIRYGRFNKKNLSSLFDTFFHTMIPVYLQLERN